MLFSQGVCRKRARGQPGRLERATVGSVRNERLERWGAAPLPWPVRYRAVHALAGGLEGLRLAPHARGMDAGFPRQLHMLALEVLTDRGVVGVVLFFGFLAVGAAGGL